MADKLINIGHLPEIEQQMVLDTVHRLTVGVTRFGPWDVHRRPSWLPDGVEEGVDLSLYLLAELYRLRSLIDQRASGAC